MKDFFKPEDFSEFESHWAAEAVQITNEKLNALIESSPVVFGTYAVDGKFDLTSLRSKATHIGYIAFIEEIKKEPCKHEPNFTQFAIDEKYNTNRPMKCKHCGVELVATWSEKK